MKKENGLTFIGTVFLIILIAFIVFGVIYFLKVEKEKEELENLKTDMLLLEVKVNNIIGEYLVEKKEEVLVGTKLSELKDQEHIKAFLEKDLFDENKKGKLYYVINQENLNELELGQIILPENTYYIVDYKDGNIYYTKGFETKVVKTYYEIKDIENINTEEINK